MVVTEEIVLKALVELRDSYEKTDYDIVADKFDIDFVTLGKYLESLRRKGYITQVFEDATVTEAGLREYYRVRNLPNFCWHNSSENSSLFTGCPLPGSQSISAGSNPKVFNTSIVLNTGILFLCSHPNISMFKVHKSSYCSFVRFIPTWRNPSIVVSICLSFIFLLSLYDIIQYNKDVPQNFIIIDFFDELHNLFFVIPHVSSPLTAQVMS